MTKIIIKEWIAEDELTEDIMYDTLFALSRVDGIRFFPKAFEVVSEVDESAKYDVEE